MFLDRVIFTPAAGGSADFLVSAAVLGYQTPSAAGAVDTATYSYAAQSSDLTQWEVGHGIWHQGTNTLSRTTVLFSSNSNSLVSFSTVPQVMITILGEDVPLIEAPRIDTVSFSSTTSGTGAFGVGSAILGYAIPANGGFVNAQKANYTAWSTDHTQWERGICTYNGATSWTVHGFGTPLSGFQDTLGGVVPLTLTPAATASAGDVMVALISCNGLNSLAAFPSTLNVPAGWTFINSSGSSGSFGGQAIFTAWKIAGASEPSSYNFSIPAPGTSDGTAISVVPAYIVYATPNGGFATFSSGNTAYTNGGNPTSPALSSPGAGGIAFAAFGYPTYGSGNAPTITPAGLTTISTNSTGLFSGYIVTGSSISSYSDTANTSGVVGTATAFSITPSASVSRSTVQFSSNSNTTVNFTNPPMVTMSVPPTILNQPVIVANLPPAVLGGRAFVSDASSPTFGATVTGGSSTPTPVYSDGTNWKVG